MGKTILTKTKDLRIASMAVAYKEERFIVPHLEHLKPHVDESLVLVSKQPWFGEAEPDKTAELARNAGATVLEGEWATEEEQRNSGIRRLANYDWIIVLDPDEFIVEWDEFLDHLETTQDTAVTSGMMEVYWKDKYKVFPPEQHNPIIAIRRPSVFVDKRVVMGHYGRSPIALHHLSWRRTDEEVKRKLDHYAHHNDFDTDKWYNEVWLKWKEGDQDFHPTNPPSLHDVVETKLPKELEKWGL